MAIETERPGAGPGTRERPASGPPIWDRPYRPAWMRVLNAAGGLVRRVGVRWPSLDVEGILADARRRAGGLSDWGDDDFREGLTVLVESFEEQGHAHTFGRFFFREYCVRTLVNRLRIQA